MAATPAGFGLAPVQGGVKEPGRLLCTITEVMFRDPVVLAESGNTYERAAIMDWWRTQGNKLRDPRTNAYLMTGELVTNWDKRREVEEFLTENPSYIPEGWSTREVPPLVPKESPQQAQQRAQPRFEDRVDGHGTDGFLAAVLQDRLLLFAMLVLVIAACCGSSFVRGVARAIEGTPASKWDSAVDAVVRMPQVPLEDVLQMMRSHPESAALQEKGLGALRTLALTTEGRADIASRDGVALILDAMRVHGSANHLQTEACGALWNLAMLDQNRELIVRDGGVDLLLQALRTHRSNVAVSNEACGTLRRLALDKPARTQMLMLCDPWGTV